MGHLLKEGLAHLDAGDFVFMDHRGVDGVGLSLIHIWALSFPLQRLRMASFGAFVSTLPEMEPS